jgi:hypothetical protein
MNNKSCANCIERPNCRDSFAAWMFFIVGIIATIAIRVVTVLIHLNPIYGKIAWYVGVGGFFVFFMYKFRVLQAKSQQIDKQSILRKIDHKDQLTNEDYRLIGTILCSLSSKKERINYLFIFGLSAVALIMAAYMDFFW